MGSSRRVIALCGLVLAAVPTGLLLLAPDRFDPWQFDHLLHAEVLRRHDLAPAQGRDGTLTPLSAMQSATIVFRLTSGEIYSGQSHNYQVGDYARVAIYTRRLSGRTTARLLEPIGKPLRADTF